MGLAWRRGMFDVATLRLSQLLATLLVASLMGCGQQELDTTAVEASPRQVPAFPGAFGYGAMTTGGRGGDVYIVTNLNDSGDGSFRHGVERADGPRTIVFGVSGLITVKRAVSLTGAHITIAGQTAPGEGVVLRKSKVHRGNILNIHGGAHDVIVRYLKFRPGYRTNRSCKRTRHTCTTNSDCPGTNNPCHVYNADGISIHKNVRNVMIDHVSTQWATDEGSNVWTESESQPVHHVTYQNSIFAAGLEPHSTGLLLGSSQYASAITVFRNYFAHNGHRNPLMSSVRDTQVVNNVTLNYAGRSGTFKKATGQGGSAFDGPQVDYVGNYHKAGRWTNRNGTVLLYQSRAPRDQGQEPVLFLEGNYAHPWFTTPSLDNWPLLSYDRTNMDGPNGARMPSTEPVHAAYKASRPNTDLGRLPIVAAERVAEVILPDVGDSRRIDALGQWQPRRDYLDQRIVDHFSSPKSEHPKSALMMREDNAYWGGYRHPIGGDVSRDMDRDGMADRFESRYRCYSAQGDKDQDGYTNLEEFLNGTVPDRQPTIRWALNEGWNRGNRVVKDRSPLARQPARLHNIENWQWQDSDCKEGRYCLELTNRRDYLQSGPIPLYYNFSFALWVKLSSFGTATVVDARSETGNRVGFELRIKEGALSAYADFGGAMRGVTTAGTHQLAENQWYHVAVTVDRGGAMQLYVDGQVVDSVNVSGYRVKTLVHGEDVFVGADSGTHGFLHGKLDDIRFYDRVLSSEEVLSLATN